MALNLLNLYTLTFALFVKINDMTKELQELKPNITGAMTMTTRTPIVTVSDVTTVLPKNVTATALIMALTLMNSNNVTTTVTPSTTLSAMTTVTTNATMTTPTILPVTDSIAASSSCYHKIVACPSTTTFKMSTTVTTNATIANNATNVTTTTTAAATAKVTAKATDEYTTYSSMEPTLNKATTDGFNSPVDDYDELWNTSTSVSAGNATSERTFTEIDNLTINAEVIYDTSSEEMSTAKSRAGSKNYETTTDRITDPVAAYLTIATSSTESDFELTTEETTSRAEAVEWTSSLATAKPLFTSTYELPRGLLDQQNSITEPTSTVDIILSTDEITEPIAVDPEVDQSDRPTEGNSESDKRRIKRTSDIIYNKTCCYRIICPKPSRSDATEMSKSFQGFTEKPNEKHLTPTEHDDAPREDLSHHAACLNITTRQRLRKLCWETMFGQELVKLTVMDLISTIISTIFVDFARALFVRYMNRCWCWNLEKRFPQYGDFKIAENILHLVNNQGMVWMGMFFSPGLPIINVAKLMIMMYVRSWAVLTCNVPHDVVFRASRSNNFYLGLLLTMLFLCVLPVGYAIVWIEPSWHCGPFSQYKKIYHIFTNSIKKAVPNPMVNKVLDYIASPAIVIPLLLLLILIIYYLASLTSSLREANNDLKTQLRRERTEERRKMFQLVNQKKRGEDDFSCMDTTLSKWRQIMPDSKLPLDGREDFMIGFTENKRTENDVLDRVREKLVHIEAEDQQPEKKQGVQHQQSAHHQKHHHHHHLHHRRPSRSEEPRSAAAMRKWKKSKAVVSRLPSSESESSDQSEAVPEIRVVKTDASDESIMAAVADNAKPRRAPSSSATGNTLKVTSCASATATGLKSTAANEPVCGIGGGGGAADSVKAVEQPVKQRARLKLAQILYKEARRRRQKYVEELQNQQE